ncbi:MAG: MTH1187 family thiamine-binding protein [Chloroflexia bacterium]
MAMMEISVVPLGTGSTSLSHYVAEVVRVVEQAGVEYEIGPMSTVVVGDVERLFALARQMHERPFALGIQRVATTIRIDDRRDKPLSIQGKVQAVREKL